MDEGPLRQLHVFVKLACVSKRLVIAHLFDYFALTDDIWCLSEPVSVLCHHVDCARDFSGHTDGNVEESSEDSLEAGQDNNDNEKYGPVDRRLNFGHLLTCGRLLFLKEEEEVKLDLLYFGSRRWHGLRVDLILLAVDLAREDRLHEEIVDVRLEIGLWQVYDTFLVDWLVI